MVLSVALGLSLMLSASLAQVIQSCDKISDSCLDHEEHFTCDNVTFVVSFVAVKHCIFSFQPLDSIYLV